MAPSQLQFSTYLGGQDLDIPLDVAVDAAGDAYVTGVTFSPDFPGHSSLEVRNEPGDAFVSKFDRHGNLIYATLLGGSYLDEGQAIAVDNSGNAVVVGLTESPDFPVTPGVFQDRPRGDREVFISKLDRFGNILASTYLGGSSTEIFTSTAHLAYGQVRPALRASVSIDQLGFVYVAGQTVSTDFPTTANALRRTGSAFAWSSFVTKLDPQLGSLMYSTYIVLERDTVILGIATDVSGDAFLVGFTNNTFRDSAFIAKLDSTGSRLLYFFQPAGNNSSARSIAVNARGETFVVGKLSSAGFPTTVNAMQHTPADNFIAAVNRQGTGLIYSSYFGGAAQDSILAKIVVDASDNIYLTGSTVSRLPVTPDAFQHELGDVAGIFRTTNGGQTWTPVMNGMPAGKFVTFLRVDPFDPLTVYAGTEEGGRYELFKTIDGGNSWYRANLGRTETPGAASGLNDLVIHPSRTSTLFLATNNGLFRSDNAGATWDQVSTQALLLLISNRTDPNMLLGESVIFGGYPQFFITKSVDSGLTWRTVFSPEVLKWFVDLVQDVRSPLRIFAPLNEGTMIASNDLGSTWTQWPHPFPGTSMAFEPGTDTFYAIREHSGPRTVSFRGDVLLVQPSTAQIVKTTDGGQDWRLATSSLPNEYESQSVPATNKGPALSILELDPNNPSTIWAGGRSGLYKSEDRAESWRPVPTIPNQQVRLIRIAPGNSSIMYAVAGQRGAPLWPRFRDGLELIPARGDAFVTKLGSDGALIYSTYLGGAGPDVSQALAVGPEKEIWITGWTRSADFPLERPIQSRISNGVHESFVSKLVLPDHRPDRRRP
jgi:photosystem II stability/assembly factor-like uncharacterized protein